MSYQRLFIVSIPRSGSTVLTKILDRHEDIFCLPESFFPALIGKVSDKEWSNKRYMAALFVVSCSDGSPLTLDEAEACIRDSKSETLDALALAAAIKADRRPESIRTIVWKFTRLVGCWHFAASTGGLFLILRRNPLNVYLSQFRVPFGQKNKNPCRFALFEASYLAAFRRYPGSRTRHLDYAHIESSIGDLVDWLGSNGRKLADSSKGIGEISGKQPWHSDINKPFKITDAEKLAMLRRGQGISYHAARIILALVPIVPRIARILADRRQLGAMRNQAQALLNGSSSSAILTSVRL